MARAVQLNETNLCYTVFNTANIRVLDVGGTKHINVLHYKAICYIC